MQELSSILNGENFSSIKGVLIDIDDTLYSYELPHEKAVEECYQTFTNEFSIFISYEDFFSIYTECRLAITKSLEPQGACRSRLFAFDRLFRNYHLKKPYLLASKYEEIYWTKFLSVMEVNFEALGFLKECMAKNILVCAVTDMQAHIQVKKLQVLNLIEYIDLIATSEEAGAEKPDENIFNLALQKMHLRKQDVVMIGDNIKKDIEGAHSIGIKAIHFKA